MTILVFFSKRFELLAVNKKLYTFLSAYSNNARLIQEPILDLICTFNMGNMFSIYKLENTEYVDCYCFYFAEDNSKYQEFCLDNLASLEKFCAYVKNNIDYMLKNSGNPCFFSYDQDFDFSSTQTSKIPEKDHNNTIDKMMLENLFLENTNSFISLSQREWQCWRLIALGQTAKTIGNQLNITQRTAEFYIDSLKQKATISDKATLASLFYNHFKEWI